MIELSRESANMSDNTGKKAESTNEMVMPNQNRPKGRGEPSGEPTLQRGKGKDDLKGNPGTPFESLQGGDGKANPPNVDAMAIVSDLKNIVASLSADKEALLETIRGLNSMVAELKDQMAQMRKEQQEKMELDTARRITKRTRKPAGAPPRPTGSIPKRMDIQTGNRFASLDIEDEETSGSDGAPQPRKLRVDEDQKEASVDGSDGDEDAGDSSSEATESTESEASESEDEEAPQPANGQQQTPVTGQPQTPAVAGQQNIGRANGNPKKKSPAFVMENLNIPKFDEAMAKKKVEGVRVMMRKDGLTEVLCPQEDRTTVFTWLNKHGKGGATATCNDERSGVSLVKGIHAEYEPQYVKDCLQSLVHFEIKEVRRFQKEARDGEKLLPWWIVSTETKEQSLELKKVAKSFGRLRTPIYWEPFRTRRATRCYECQRFRHVGRNCLYPKRCALCAKKHHTDDCELAYPSADTVNHGIYRCANCNVKGHWAGDYTRCPELIKENGIALARANKQVADRKERLTAQKEMRTKQRVPTQEDFVVRSKKLPKEPAPVNVTTPVWNVGTREQRTQQSQQQGVWDQMNGEAMNLFNRSAAQLMEDCIVFVDNYKQLNNEAERRVSWLQFMVKYAQCQK